MDDAGFIDVSEILESGVYALLYRGAVVYVGQSKRMVSRIYAQAATARKLRREGAQGQFPKKGFQFDEVWIRPAPMAELDDIEQLLIHKYLPKYNSAMKAGAPMPAGLKAFIDAAQERTPTTLAVEIPQGFSRRGL